VRQPTPFAALAAVAKYTLQQMTPPTLRPFPSWLLFAATAAPCTDTPLCTCARATAPADSGIE